MFELTQAENLRHAKAITQIEEQFTKQHSETYSAISDEEKREAIQICYERDIELVRELGIDRQLELEATFIVDHFYPCDRAYLKHDRKLRYICDDCHKQRRRPGDCPGGRYGYRVQMRDDQTPVIRQYWIFGCKVLSRARKRQQEQDAFNKSKLKT